MSDTSYSLVLEEVLSQYMDSKELLDNVLRALNEETKEDVFLYIARMHDIDVPDCK